MTDLRPMRSLSRPQKKAVSISMTVSNAMTRPTWNGVAPSSIARYGSIGDTSARLSIVRNTRRTGRRMAVRASVAKPDARHHGAVRPERDHRLRQDVLTGFQFDIEPP